MLRKREDTCRVLLQLFFQRHFLTIEHRVQTGMEPRTVVHLQRMGQLMEHDKTLQPFGQEQGVEREVDVVIGLGRQSEQTSFLFPSATAPPAVGCIDAHVGKGRSNCCDKARSRAGNIPLA